MSRRVCIVPGCPVLVDAGSSRGRCADHRRVEERARGSASQRGYGVEHKRLREAWKQRMESGESVVCWRCREERGVVHVVDPECFDLGHDDHDRSVYRGPECQSGNRATASRRPHPVGPSQGRRKTVDKGSERFGDQSTSTDRW